VNTIISTLIAHLPSRRKSTPSGWLSFDAVCCHNRGETRDTKKRGGVLVNQDTAFQYHCFNCGFKAGWSQGKLLSANTKKLFQWLGMAQDTVNQLGMYALKIKDDEPKAVKHITTELVEKHLPNDAKPLLEWAEHDLEHNPQVMAVFEYLATRGLNYDWYPWHWSPESGYRDRIIVPFYSNDRIVGFTARKITEGKPKYISDSQPSYVFNLDRQDPNRQYVIMVEGPLDAIAIDGVAILGNEANDAQITRIRQLGREVIVVPDRDRAGAKMIRVAREQGWSVSLPPWDASVKDAAEAVRHYGRLYTLSTILHYKETNTVKQQLMETKLLHV